MTEPEIACDAARLGDHGPDGFAGKAASGAPTSGRRQGPLAKLRVIELSSLGPVPFCCQMLGDMGADILRVQRPKPYELHTTNPYATNARNRRSLTVDASLSSGRELVLRMVDRADVLVEGFRPGTAERLGLGPEECLTRNPRLIYGRCSGWGRAGSLSARAGHDVNYVAMAGVLSLIGDPSMPPPPPLGLVGDHGGAGMLLTVGVLAALQERSASGLGQVVDTAIVDGALALATSYYEGVSRGERSDDRWTGMADGSTHFYATYETSDGRYLSVGAMEPQFYAELLRVLGFEYEELPPQWEESSWPRMKALFQDRIRTRSRDEWCALAEGYDCCIAPVLTLSEAPRHPYHQERGSFVEVGDTLVPRALPDFSRTPTKTPAPLTAVDNQARHVLAEWGLDETEAERLLRGRQ